jgi:hypothetical protein
MCMREVVIVPVNTINVLKFARSLGAQHVFSSRMKYRDTQSLSSKGSIR